MPEAEKSEVNRLIEELHSNSAESAVMKLISLGNAAIRPLRNFLLFGRPSNVFEPRYFAVEALAGLRAQEVLAEFLRSESEITDPAVRLGEEAVKEKAARELTSWKTDDVFYLLLDLIRRRPLAGFIEAIGEFGRPEPIPYFIEALGDDVCSPAAEKALKQVYPAARPLLITAATKPIPESAEETPSSIRRRRSACRLLAEGGIRDEDWPALAQLLDDADLTILTAVSGIAAEIGSAEEKRKAANRLLDALAGVEWSLQDDIEKILVSCFQECKSRIDEEISLRRPVSGEKAVWDPVFAALSRIKRKAEERKHDE